LVPILQKLKLVELYPELHEFSQVNRAGSRYVLSEEYTV
jgi:hypothetical protein